ncbi:MAG: prenyltransferase [Gammaproteobacteria bacterium]|nr:prenyltransferase [Gammaproteobacteria bacterium]
MIDLPGDHMDSTADYIVSMQQEDGAIPWFSGGITDPWDHVEAAMGLSLAGHVDAAHRAYRWLADTQRPDGTWLAAYRDGAVSDDTRAETNFVAYAATGIWHHYLVTGDRRFLGEFWSVAERAMQFVLDLQSPHGDVYWALDTRTGISKDALVTGCSSIHKSLECMANLAFEVERDPRPWLESRARLGHALRHRPERFDRTWESKARYSMDWFYPVLGGAFTGADAAARIDSRWHEFVEDGLGCRCVVEEPWVTVAESCELVLALLSIGRVTQARTLFNWLPRFRGEHGAWWTGYQWREDVLWPAEQPTWTAAAVLLAADALTERSAASGLFTEIRLPPLQHAERVGPRQLIK